MGATSTKGVKISISNGAIAATKLSPTAVTASTTDGAETTIVVANTLTAGAVVVFPSTTGYDGLNSKAFAVKTATATEFTIMANTFGQSGPMASGLEVEAYPTSSLVNLCLASFDISQGTTNDIDTSTFCASGSILGTTTPGTITLTGYVDKTDVGFKELIKAGVDNKPRVISIELPGQLGYLIGVVAFSEMSFQVPLSGAVGFTITASQNTSIKYVFA